MSVVRVTLEDLFNLPTSEIVNPDNYKAVSKISIDSRKISKRSLFVAIKGERFDGHNFVRDVIKNGASAVVIERKKYSKFRDIDVPVILVDKTIEALGGLAKVWRSKLNAKVVSITGSTGKTTTKDMIGTLLSEKYKMKKTSGNNNNHIGVPLTIFEANKNDEILVLEHGTNHFGEIDYTASIAQPDYALITNIGSSHLVFLKNKQGVLQEKKSLFDVTAKKGGALLINEDDKLLKDVYPEYKNRITYGSDQTADVQGKILSYSVDGKTFVELRYKGKTIKAHFDLYGEQNFENFLAAASVAFKLGLNKKQILSGMKKLSSPDKRLNVNKYSDFLLIDDTYNANPESMKASIKLLGRIRLFTKKIAILGDMFELGTMELLFHKGLASVIRKNKINTVYTIGNRMKILHEELDKTGIECKHFSRRDALSEFIAKTDLSDSSILVKGSRGMKMEDFTAIIREKI